MMIGFSTIITVMIISSSYMLYELNSVSNSAKHILGSNVQTQEIARELQDLIQDENEYAAKYLISNDKAYFSLFMKTVKQIDHSLSILFNKQSSSEDHTLILNMQKAHTTIINEFKHNKVDSPTVQNEIRQDKMKILQNFLNILINKNQSFIGQELSRIELVTVRSIQVALLLIIGTLFVAILAALIITQTITKPIGELIKGTVQIAGGNFEKFHVTSNDEIALLADAVNEMSAKIHDTNNLRTQTMQQISHELKNPLQAMQSAHDVLKASKAVSEDKLNMLEVIQNGIKKVTNFSQQYLDLAKIESGVIQYNMEPVDLIIIIKPIINEIKLVANTKNIILELNSVAVPKIMADTDKVSIIFYNLISNAVKYTPENGMIKVSIEPCELGVQIAVQDSGIGIAKNEIPNIFTRFYQASNIKKVKNTGSGIGLAIVKAYTEGHGGRIYVESSPDTGSSFKIELPDQKNSIETLLFQ